MNADIKELLKAKGYNADAMEKDNVPVSEVKELLKAKGYNVDAMEKDGLFAGSTPAPRQVESKSTEPIESTSPTQPTPSPLGEDFGLMGALQGKEQPQNPFGDRNPMDTQPKETVNPDGTISTLTTGQPEDKQRAASKFLVDPITTGVGQAVAGARRSITLPLAKMLEDGLNSAGFDVGHESTENLKKVNSYIESYNKKHPDEFMHPSTVGSLISQVFVPIAKTKGVVIATEAFLSALDGIGKNNSYKDVPEDAAIGAAFGATSMWLFNQIAKRVGPLSYGTKLLIAKHPELTEEKALKILEGVPKEDQAYVLGQALDDSDFAGFFKGAIGKSNKDRLKLKWLGKQRNKSVADIIGDTESQVAEAKKYYGEMADMLAADSHNTFDFSPIAHSLDSLIKRYEGNPKALSIVNNMKADIEAGAGHMSARTALEFRQDLNYLLNRAKRYKEKEALELLKTSTDRFIKNNLSDDAFAMVEDATQNYARAMNNRDFIELLDKHTKKHITDWAGFKKALKEEKLDSPEVDKAIDVVNAFAKKFKLDKEFRNMTKTKGQNGTALSALGVRSWILQHILDPLDTAFVGSTRHKELIIQDEILKGIRKAGKPTDLINEILRNKKLNETLSKPELQATVAKVEQLLLPHKPDAATSVTLDGNEVRPLYATERGTIGDTPEAPAAREHFMDSIDNQPAALPAPREPQTQEALQLESGATKFVSPGGRVSMDMDMANPPKFQASTNTIDVHNIMNTVTANQRNLGVRLRLRLADSKTAKYGKGLSNEQLNLDREKSVNAINAIINKSEREALSRRDRETLIKGLARVRQIDKELDVRGYEETYQKSLDRDVPSQLDRPNRRYRIRSGSNQNTPNRQTGATPTLRNTSFTNMPDIHTFEESFKRLGRRNGINITRLSRTPNGDIKIHIEGAGTVHFYRGSRNYLAFNTTNFNNGSGIGGKFYKTVFDVSRELNIPYRNDNGLTEVNTIRLPINIYKYKLETGYNVLHSQQRLHTMAANAIRNLNSSLSRRGFTDLAHLTDAEIEKIGPKFGANSNIRTGVNSLKLYRKMARILASGGTLSLAILAPLIDAAYNEIEGKEDGSL